MGFKMKGSPAATGMISGTPAHASALKMKADRGASASPLYKELTANELVAKRTKLKEKETKREAKRKAGKKVLFGNLKTKINKKKLEKVQKKIDTNPEALSWRKTTELPPEKNPTNNTGPQGPVDDPKPTREQKRKMKRMKRKLEKRDKKNSPLDN